MSKIIFFSDLHYAPELPINNGSRIERKLMWYAEPMLDKITNKIIGSTSIYEISTHHARCEIGSTWLTPTYWRTAINTNCKYLLLQYIFEQMKLERVQLKTDNLNIRSQNAIERIGAKFEGRLRSHMRRKDQSMRDTMVYSIIREEWPEVKAMLEGRIFENIDR